MHYLCVKTQIIEDDNSFVWNFDTKPIRSGRGDTAALKEKGIPLVGLQTKKEALCLRLDW